MVAVSTKNVLLLFAKYPEPGKVKTRMYPRISYKESAELYRAMVEDLFYSLSNSNEYNTVIYFSPKTKKTAFREWFGAEAVFRVQKGVGLGAKLRNAFNESFNTGYKKVAAIGADCLDLTPEDIGYAFNRLTADSGKRTLGDSSSGKRDVVIGPTEDGGYYLIGMSRVIPELFENVPWSTENVFPDTVKKLKSLGIGYTELVKKYDIDSFEEASRFLADVRSGKNIRARRTQKIIETLLSRFASEGLLAEQD